MALIPGRANRTTGGQEITGIVRATPSTNQDRLVRENIAPVPRLDHRSGYEVLSSRLPSPLCSFPWHPGLARSIACVSSVCRRPSVGDRNLKLRNFRISRQIDSGLATRSRHQHIRLSVSSDYIVLLRLTDTNPILIIGVRGACGEESEQAQHHQERRETPTILSAHLSRDGHGPTLSLCHEKRCWTKP
jgi:hypothetical protein